MFSKLLKLLRIQKDKPVSATENSVINEKKADNKKETAIKETAIKEGVQEEKPADALNTAEIHVEPETVKSLSEEYPGLKANFITVLEEAGFTSKALIDNVDDKDILALKGIGQATLKILRS
jgi:hypothetical protein